MKRILFISLIFCWSVCAKINIFIKTSSNLNKIKVNFTGADTKLVTDEEVILFNITNNNLNTGIKYEYGRIPDGIFLRDPTPYEDLYKDYNWPQVARVLKIKSAEIVECVQENVIIKTHEYINNTTMSLDHTTDMVEAVENTLLSQWSDYGLPQDEVYYSVNISFGYGKWNFSTKWRNEKLQFVRLPFGAPKSYLTVSSGQTIVSQLRGTKVLLILEIDYLSYLAGSIISDYEQRLGTYHFWAMPLQDVMRAARLKNEVFTKQFFELRFYSEPYLKIFDKDTRVELKKYHWIKKYVSNLKTQWGAKGSN